MLRAMERDFGGLDAFKEEFAKQGVAQFGSGWVWLVADGNKLSIEKTPDAVTPMAEGKNACSPSMSGSTPIISITRTSGRISSKR